MVIVDPVARFTQGKPFFLSALAELQWGSCDLRALPSAPVPAVIRCLAAPCAVRPRPDLPSRFGGAGRVPFSLASPGTGRRLSFSLTPGALPPAWLSLRKPLPPARQRR